VSPERNGPGGLTRPVDRSPPEPLLLHRAVAGEPVIGIPDLIEWLLLNDAFDLPQAIVAGIAQLRRDEPPGGGIILPAELDVLQPTIVPEFAPGMRRGEQPA